MAAKRGGNGGASVFPPEAFKLFRQMADSLNKLQEGQELLRKEVGSLRKDVTKELAGLYGLTEKMHSALKQEFKHDDMRLHARMDALEPRVSKLEDEG